MLKSYIPTSLIAELKQVFPNELPTLAAYEKGNVTGELVAFHAGIQHCISYLERSIDDREDVVLPH